MKKNIEYVEMHIDEMKAVKESWQNFLRMAKNNLRHLQCVEETKDNRWELKSLEMSYNFFIEQIKKIVSEYSQLINLGEDCDLEESDFVGAMKVIKRLNLELKREYAKKSFKELNIKYVEGLRESVVNNI